MTIETPEQKKPHRLRKAGGGRRPRGMEAIPLLAAVLTSSGVILERLDTRSPTFAPNCVHSPAPAPLLHPMGKRVQQRHQRSRQ